MCSSLGPAEYEWRAVKTEFVLTYSYMEYFSVKCNVCLVVCIYLQIIGVEYTYMYEPTATLGIVFCYMITDCNHMWFC